MMSSWGGMNFVPSQTDPPLVLFVAGRRATVSFTDPLDVVLSLSEPPGCFFRAAAGGAATGRSGAAAVGGDAPIAARGATVVAGAAGLRQSIRNWWWRHFRRRYWHRLRSSSVSGWYCVVSVSDYYCCARGGSRCSIGGIGNGRHGTPAVY